MYTYRPCICTRVSCLCIGIIGVRDERRREGQQRGDAPKPRKPRADKGVPRGPRALKGTKAYQIGHLSLLRFRHGRERQVSQRTLDAVREAQGAGVEPWNTAEHDKAVHVPAPEGGTTNPMESEPPESETCDDEGGDDNEDFFFRLLVGSFFFSEIDCAVAIRLVRTSESELSSRFCGCLKIFAPIGDF